MKKLSLLIAALISGQTFAPPSSLNPGASLTTGPSSNTYSLFAARNNPALGSLTIREDDHWRMNYLPGLAMGVELGNVNDFVDEVDELIDILDDPSLTDDSIQATLDRFNNVLSQMGEHGYLKAQNNITAPLFPLFWRPNNFYGTFAAELGVNTQIRLAVLDDELTYDDQNQNFSTASSAYIKSGIETRASLGYSREIPDLVPLNSLGAQVFAGIKLNLIQLELSKQVLRLQQLEGQGIEDVVEDEYENNLVKSNNIGIDIGMVMVGDKYRVGFTITDINSPSFDYGAVGVNCEQYGESSRRRNNCEAAAYFATDLGQFKARETHTKHPVGTIDGSYTFFNALTVSSSLDLASYNDIVGEENQWFNLSSSYDAKSIWIPDVRVGYHLNMAGSELSSVSLGLSLFNILSLDAEMGLEDISVDGNTAPRKMAFSLSVSENF